MFLAVVTLQPVPGPGPTTISFRGFLIQPRLAADDTTVVGSFTAPGVGDLYRLSSCTPPEVSTITTEINMSWYDQMIRKVFFVSIVTSMNLTPVCVAICVCVHVHVVLYYVQGSVTHMSGSDKPSITISWTSPPVGTGAIIIRYATCALTKIYAIR